MKKLITLQRRHVGDYSSTDSRKSLSGVTSLAQRLVLFLAVLLMGSNGAWAEEVTLFSFSVTSSTITNGSSYTANGGIAKLTGNLGESFSVGEVPYYKFNSNSTQWTFTLSNGTFAVGDKITFTVASGNSAKNGKGILINEQSTPITGNIPANSTLDLEYNVVADDGIAGTNSFYIKRNDSDVKFGTVTVTRNVTPGTGGKISLELFGHGSSNGLGWSKDKTYYNLPDIGSPEDDNYTFNGWYTNQALTTPVAIGTQVNADVTLYAKWTKKTAITPISTAMTVTFASSKPSEDQYFDWFGAISNASSTAQTNATAANGGVSCTQYLKFDSKGSLSFNLATSADVELYFADANANGNIKIDGTSNTIDANSKVALNLAAGTHTITRDQNGPFLFLIKITPYVPTTYTITYNPGANGTGSIAAGEKEQGVAFTLSSSTFTRLGYSQTGWATTDGGAKAYELGGSYTTDADITLYPVWTEYVGPKIVYHANGGNGDDYTQNITLNTNNRFEACRFTYSDSNYKFGGWALTPDGNVNWPDQDNPKLTSANVDSNNELNLYAVWVLKSGYSITYQMNGHGVQIPTVYGQSKIGYINIQYPGVWEGYYFDSWYLDEACTQDVSALRDKPLKENVTLYAKWNQFTDYTYTKVTLGANDTENGDNLKAAITAASSNPSVRKIIYLPNGTYDFGSVKGPVINGDNISFIGESQDGVIIKNTYGDTNAKSNSSNCATISVGQDKKNIYFENLTIQNDYDWLSKGLIDCAVYDGGSNTIFKNVTMKAYQDTYTTTKGDKVRYLKNCEIWGSVDFICGPGKVFFDECKLVTRTQHASNDGVGTSYLTANSSDIAYYDLGYIFNNCTVESHSETVYFGRIWDATPMVAFINTELSGTGKVATDRWVKTTMGHDVLPYKISEYGSHGTLTNAATPASNSVTFKTDNNSASKTLETVIGAAEAATYTMTNIYPYWIANNYYTITKDEPANGTVNVYPTYVAAGDKVKAFATPNPGNVKEAWNVYRTGNEASKVTVDANDMFVMPAYNTTVSANFVDDGTVGTADCETAYAGDFSQPISIAAGKTRHITFNNKSKGDYNWNNFYLIAMGSSTPSVAEGQNYMRLRADWFEDVNSSTTVRLMKPTAGDLVEADWRNDMKDADVDMYVSYSGSRFYVNATITAKGGSERSYTYTAESPVINEAANPAYLFLSIQKAYLSNIHVDDETDANAVSVDAGANGTVSPMTNSIGMNVSNGTCVQAGEKINFTATPADGYKFSNWTTNEGNTVVTTAKSYEATIAGPTALTANFVSNATQVVAAPVIDASNPSAVTITAEGGAKIYYTLDGTNNPANGVEYTGPFALTETTPIRAVASTDNAQTFSAETIANVNVNTGANVKLLGSASLSSATLKPYEWNITEGANAGTYSLSCDDSGRKRALWSLFETDDAYKVSANYQYHLTTPLGFKVTKIAIIGRSNSSSNDANITLDGQNIGKLMQSSPEVIKTLTYEVANPEYGKEFTIQSDREMLINIELWGTMSTVFTAEATSAQPAMGAASVSEAVVASGSNVTFYAQPEDGYAFVNWTNASGEEVSTDAEYTVPASANLNLTANFRVAGSEDATLTSLSYNGINIPLTEGVYTYNVRALSTVMPNVVAVANDENASVDLTQATAYNGTATVVVTAEAGNKQTYTVNFTESTATPANGVTWTLNGGGKTTFAGEVTMPGTDSGENLYAMYINGNGASDYYGNMLYYNGGMSSGNRYIRFTGVSGEGKITINTRNYGGTSYEVKDGSTVVASCNPSNAWSANVTSSSCTYDPAKTYDIVFPARVQIESITWTPYTAKSGSKVTAATVAGGGAKIDDETHKITYVVPYGGTNASTDIPVVMTLSTAATATGTGAMPATITSDVKFNVTLAAASGSKATGTVVVTAEDHSTTTYNVELLRGSQATSTVLFVETDGQNEYLTKEHIGNAKYATVSYDGTGENTYDGNKGTYYDIKNSKKSIEIVENGAMFYNVYVQHNNTKDTRKLDLYVDGVMVKTITVAPKVLNESGILPINADGTNDGENHTIKLVGAGSDVYPVKIKFYTTKQAASLTPAAVAIKMGKVTEDIAVKASSGAVVSFDETASAAANEYVTVSYSNGSLSLTPKKAGTTTLYFDIAAAGAFNAKDNAAMTVTISKQDLTLTYSPSAYECNLDDEESTRPAWVTPTLVAKDEDGKTVTGLTYTYFSDDESIATVDGNGTITRKEATAVGSAGIYATFAGNNTYNDAQAVFTVKYVQGFTYQITDKTKFAGDKTNPAVREQIVLTDKEDNPLVYATFGGWTRNDNTYRRPGATSDRTDKWAKPVRYTGTLGNKPLYVDGFEFATSGADNACEETMDKTLASGHEDYEKSGGYFRIPDANGKYPFTLPVRGAYMTFEPTQNGKLTVYILQNGAFNSKVDADGNSVVIPGEFRKHSFYVADQEGNIYYQGSPWGGLTYVSKQNVSHYYQNSHPTDKVWTLSSDEKTILDENGAKKYDADINSMDVAKWPEYYKNYTADERKRISDNWEDEVTGHGERQMVTVLDDGSHFLAMKAYAKYSIDVLGGQTYYIFSNRSKLGFCGMNFVPDADPANAPTAVLNLDENVAYVPPTLGAVGSGDVINATKNNVAQHGNVSIPQYKTVTLNRSFTGGIWSSICLPFTMTEKEVIDNFGEGTDIIIYDGVEDDADKQTFHFVYHEIQSLLAGYPYFIKPGKDVSKITVSNKIIDPATPLKTFSMNRYFVKETNPEARFAPENAGGCLYTATGFDGYSKDVGAPYSMAIGDLYVSGTTGDLLRAKKVVKMKGYRSYIRSNDISNNAKSIFVSFGMFDDEEDVPTGIMNVGEDAGIMDEVINHANGVYNINGQKMNGDINSLPAGVYIINGKKMQIK